MMPTHKALTSGMSRLSAARDVVTVPAKSAIGTAYSNTIRFSVDASFDPKSCRRAAPKPSKKVNAIGRSALKIVSSMLPACPCLSQLSFRLARLNRPARPPRTHEGNRNILQQRSRSLDIYTHAFGHRDILSFKSNAIPWPLWLIRLERQGLQVRSRRAPAL